ncbi:hypothetical protein [Ramlibacter sp.]|uniref:hypothetical protein n=1 Tax=Ramlibacter sp. TaxID=1917967 RepID=UPI002BFA17EB|nr:hypothetical protein [Ramlibacter sp.]HWI84028.1 hypothetical protein [Ramlibacter sp.]
MTRSASHAPTSRTLPGALAAAALLAACATAPLPPASPGAPGPATGAAPEAAAPPQRFRCDQGIEFTARYGPDSVAIEAGARGREVLLRDAGGVTPQQTVYSNDRLRAEFGLGASGAEAILRYAEPALVAHCTRQ